MVNPKIRTNVSVFSVATGASLTPEKRIQGRKKDIKSLAMYPQRKYPIPNQYINMLGTEKYQIPSPQLAKFCTGYKSIRNQAEDYCNYSTDTSRTDKEDSVDNLKAINTKILMTNTKRTVRSINTVLKVLSTELKNEKH